MNPEHSRLTVSIPENRSTRARTWDYDDTMFGRERITRRLAAVKAKLRPSVVYEYPWNEMPIVVREVINKPLEGVAEKVSYAFHARRQIFPFTPQALEAAISQGIDNYGNTGRSSKLPWVEMSEQALIDGGIDSFIIGTFFTPDGMRTALSKAAAIAELRNYYPDVSHVDDDPRTVVFLAGLFPDSTFYLVQYGTNGLLYDRETLEEFPNIKPVAVITEVS